MSKEKNIPPTYKRSAMSLKTLINKVCAERGRFKDGSDTKQFYTDIAIELMKVESKRWIPCSEKLPEYTTDYLVMVGIIYDGMGMTNEIRTALYHTVGKTWLVYDDKKNTLIGEVIAWQELPQPYKAASE